MKFTVNMLLTCILYCAPGPAAIKSTVGRFLSRMSSFVLVRFSSGDTVALLRESYTFVERYSNVSSLFQ